MGTIVHKRYANQWDFASGTGQPPFNQNNLKLFSPGGTSTLVRTRLWIEFRVESYSLTDTRQADLEWFAGIFPMVGVQHYHGATDPASSDNPISGDLANNWVIYEALRGENEQMAKSPNGWNTWSRAWRAVPSTIDSHAERSPHGDANQSVWLSWTWIDPNFLLNRSHASFDLVYDTQVQVMADFFFKQH